MLTFFHKKRNFGNFQIVPIKRFPKFRSKAELLITSYVAQISEAPISDDDNKSNHLEVDGVNNADLSLNCRQATRSTATTY